MNARRLKSPHRADDEFAALFGDYANLLQKDREETRCPSPACSLTLMNMRRDDRAAFDSVFTADPNIRTPDFIPDDMRARDGFVYASEGAVDMPEEAVGPGDKVELTRSGD